MVKGAAVIFVAPLKLALVVRTTQTSLPLLCDRNWELPGFTLCFALWWLTRPISRKRIVICEL